MAKVHSLTAARLRELLHYDPLTGIFTWRISRGRVRAGAVAGTLSHGYVAIAIDGVIHMAHRLAVLYMTGEWPNGDVDHKFGIKNDNRWSELLSVPHAVNMQNRSGPTALSTSGYLGVRWCKRAQRWIARIYVDGRQKQVGSFMDPAAASAARTAAKRALYPDARV